MSDNRYTIASVQRSLKLLKLFNSERDALTLSEMSRLSGVNKSSILRVITTLTQEHFLKYDELTKKYRPGIELFRLGTVVAETMDLRTIARPHIEKVCEETGLIVHIGVLEETHVIIVEKLLPKQYRDSVSMVSKVGGIVPVHCTGVGKVLLAFQDEDEVEQIMEGYEYKKFGENTITNFPDLRKSLDMIRMQGYGVNDGEHEPYIKCYTFPIYDYEKRVVAAMSLTGLKEKMDNHGSKYIIDTLKKVTLDISLDLGYRP